MAKAKDLSGNSDAANDLIQAAGAQKTANADTQQTPGTSENVEQDTANGTGVQAVQNAPQTNAPAIFERDLKAMSTEQLELFFLNVSSELQSRPDYSGGKQAETTVTQNENLRGVGSSMPVRTLGDDAIEATHADGRTTTFSATAWRNLPEGKDGWQQVVETPPEVQNLKKS